MNSEYQQARINRDKNFDGKFFFGVKTTGIFCRPSCPSPTAREENVVYFKEMFQALEQHFRPCLRCRPDIHLPHYTANAGGTLLVNTALKMIYDGFLNDHSVAQLARELAVSDRHLRKLFIENLGVPPVKIARYHRALFAKRLLLFSHQSVTDIAFASGFGSLRQFNQLFKETFGLSPSQLRKTGTSPSSLKPSNEPGNMALHLPYSPPFSFSQILDFLRPRAIQGVELVGEASYARTFRTQRSQGYFTVRDLPEQSTLQLEIQCDNIQCYMEIYNRVRRMFDLDTDFRRITRAFKADPLLSKGMVKGQVPRLPKAFEPFEFAVRAVLGQQVSVRAATALAGRIAARTELNTPTDTPA
ncbi:MAG: helix-turn-helix domain-containing protein, partial [Desulfobacterales bacterium]|nr:helix-turn-helix domain-containing protein [Desulfobacterales bacterium]